MDIVNDSFTTPGALETTDDTWSELTSMALPPQSAATVRIAVVARHSNAADTRHWFSVVGVVHDGQDSIPSAPVPLVAPFGSASLESCEVRIGAMGDFIRLEVKGLPATAVWWAGSLQGELAYPDVH